MTSDQSKSQTNDSGGMLSPWKISLWIHLPPKLSANDVNSSFQYRMLALLNFLFFAEPNIPGTH